MRASRTRDFATVIYPESAPENWLDILKEQKIQALVSPLHDSDLNADNTPKKPHYHVHIMFEGPKTKEQAVSLFSLIGGVGCEIVNSRRGMARYLTHEDNPEKHKYSRDDVIQIGGVDYFEIINLPSDKYAPFVYTPKKRPLHFVGVTYLLPICRSCLSRIDNTYTLYISYKNNTVNYTE